MTKKQLLAAELMIQYPLKNDRQIAEMVGFTPQSLCQVKKTKVFQDYLHNRLREEWKDSIRIAQKTMINLAKTGDRQAAQYILDSGGYGAPQEINVNSNDIHIIIDNENEDGLNDTRD